MATPPVAGGMTVARLCEIQRILEKPCDSCDRGPSEWWLLATLKEALSALEVSWSESAKLRERLRAEVADTATRDQLRRSIDAIAVDGPKDEPAEQLGLGGVA